MLLPITQSLKIRIVLTKIHIPTLLWIYIFEGFPYSSFTNNHLSYSMRAEGACQHDKGRKWEGPDTVTKLGTCALVS